MSYLIERRVGISQTDGSGKLRLCSALDFIIDCIVFEQDSLGTFGNYLRENNLGMFQVHTQVDILRRPEYGEKLGIETIVYGCSGIRGYRNTLVRDEAGRVCIATFSTGAFVNRKTGRPCKLSPEVVDSFGKPLRYDMEYLPAKITLPGDAEWCSLPPRTALPCYLDINGHVNSNRYIEFAVEALPADFSYDRVRVEYRRQTKAGEMLHTEFCRTEEAFFVRISGGDGEPKAVVSFCRR